MGPADHLALSRWLLGDPDAAPAHADEVVARSQTMTPPPLLSRLVRAELRARVGAPSVGHAILDALPEDLEGHGYGLTESVDVWRARVLMHEGRHADALRCFERALSERHPTGPRERYEVFAERAVAQLALDLPGAEAALRDVLATAERGHGEHDTGGAKTSHHAQDTLGPMPELPTTFGKYFLTETLATGGMAEIYLAKLVGPAGFEKQLVIKQIHPKLTGQRHFVDLFVAEAKTLVTLAHGNIVPVYELGVIDDTYFIAMDYIDGPTLYRLTEMLARKDAVMAPTIAAWITSRIVEPN